MSCFRPFRFALAAAAIWSGGLNGQFTKETPVLADSPEELGSAAITMRDGVHLAADVFLPRATGRWPTVLIRTPYNRSLPSTKGYRFFVQHGYAVVVEDIRGRGASQGSFQWVSREGPDASDTIDWIAAQAWSNGRVAMAGSSYLGLVQWWAAAEDNPHLFSISPTFSGDDEYQDRFYSPGGAMKLGHRLLWLAENLTPPYQVRPLFVSYIDHLPLRTADLAATGISLPMWKQAIDHPSYDAFWRQSSLRERVSRVKVPVLSLGGWFDNYAESDLDMFTRLSLAHTEVETWIGPWAHNPGLTFATYDFGVGASIPIRGLQLAWFDKWMHDASPEVYSARPVLHIFVMGPDRWREEHEWPLARTQYTPLYLSSKGNANSLAGDGSLRWQPTRKADPDTFTYDPKDPVPTAGGSICCEPKILPPGPLDQTRVEHRPDVLVYTSSPLATELEVTGPVRAVLYVATSANDTDFTAKLVDVEPNGHALLVCDGIQRLRYRLSLAKPVFVKRNSTYQISIDAGVTSYVFASGHRIRLEVSSSNFPRFDRNLNSSSLNADQTKSSKARQSVFHEEKYQSALILPVIPRGSAPTSTPHRSAELLHGAKHSAEAITHSQQHE